MNRCSSLDIIAEPKSIYMYNNYDDSFLEEFEVIYDHVRDAVENAEEIESTIDDLYENWSLMIVISYLGVFIEINFQKSENKEMLLKKLLFIQVIFSLSRMV